MPLGRQCHLLIVASCVLSAADLEPQLSGGKLGYARPRTQDSSFSLDGGAFDGDGQGAGAEGTHAELWRTILCVNLHLVCTQT